MDIQFDEIEGTIVDERTQEGSAESRNSGDRGDPLAMLRATLARIEQRVDRLRAD